MKEYTYPVRNNSGRQVTATLVGHKGLIEIDGITVAIVDYSVDVGGTKSWKMLSGAARGLRRALEHASRNRANRAARRAAEEAALAATDAMADVAEVQP